MGDRKQPTPVDPTQRKPDPPPAPPPKRGTVHAVQLSIGDDVYTTADQVRVSVLDPKGGFGVFVVDIAPGETKTVTLPSGKVVTIHRPLETSTP